MRPKWHFGTRGQRGWIWTVTMRQGFQSTVIIGQGRRGFLLWKFLVSLVFWERHLTLLLSSSFWLPLAGLTHTSGSILLRGEGKLLDPSHWTRNNFLLISLVLISFLFSWFLEAGLFLVFWMSDWGSIFFLLLSWIADLRYQRGIAWCIAFLLLVVLLSLLHSTVAQVVVVLLSLASVSEFLGCRLDLKEGLLFCLCLTQAFCLLLMYLPRT